jgi:7,8-dihydropterin-6-yl-methyl-4-(beta-D-ribofuranosyl)aminobenzene 5'-phosphate synthase
MRCCSGRERKEEGESVSRIERFGETQDVEITVLVDNRADLLVKSTETVKRFTKGPLLAEHGYAAVVDLREAGVRILWDAGISQVVLLENARCMEIDLTTVDRIALSHGHGDHYAAMTEVIKAVAKRPSSREWAKDASMEEIAAWVKGKKVPLIVHPAAFRERWGIGKDGRKYGPSIVPRAEWEAAGAELILAEGPHELGPGCWTTGTVPRLGFERAGTPSSRAYREDGEFVRDYLEDDQSIAIHVKDKGLVVLTGCAHAGVVNTVNYAREISGVEEVWAILGGFHLAPAKEEEIERTIDEIMKTKPSMIVPSHCTGFKAMARFAERMPEAFVLGAVGTRYLF